MLLNKTTIRIDKFTDDIYFIWIDREYLMDYEYRTLGDAGKVHPKYAKRFL